MKFSSFIKIDSSEKKEKKQAVPQETAEDKLLKKLEDFKQLLLKETEAKETLQTELSNLNKQQILLKKELNDMKDEKNAWETEKEAWKKEKGKMFEVEKSEKQWKSLYLETKEKLETIEREKSQWQKQIDQLTKEKEKESENFCEISARVELILEILKLDSTELLKIFQALSR